MRSVARVRSYGAIFFHIDESMAACIAAGLPISLELSLVKRKICGSVSGVLAALRSNATHAGGMTRAHICKQTLMVAVMVIVAFALSTAKAIVGMTIVRSVKRQSYLSQTHSPPHSTRLQNPA